MIPAWLFLTVGQMEVRTSITLLAALAALPAIQPTSFSVSPAGPSRQPLNLPKLHASSSYCSSASPCAA